VVTIAYETLLLQNGFPKWIFFTDSGAF